METEEIPPPNENAADENNQAMDEDKSADVCVAHSNFADNENTATTIEETGNDLDGKPNKNGSAKKSRKRKKQMYNAIRQQMEFYFSDANLSKDRFLKRLIAEDLDIPLDVFLTFNKIKSLATTVEEIEKAVSTSDKLQLSEDRKKVHRIAPFKATEPKSADDSTIYVEALPNGATHDWVRKIFEQYGPVAYVSLPKFRTSQQIKEFAFVEFESRASVLRAMTSFAQFGGALNIGSDPEKLGSVIAYLREQQEQGVGTDTDEKGTEEKPKVRKTKERINDATVDGTTNTSEVDGDQPASKRPRKCSTDETESAGPAEAATDDEEEDEEEDDDEDAAKKKVRRKKSTSRNHNRLPVEHQLDACVNSLRITTKLEWKRLRNKYLNQQREKVKQMKKQLWMSRKALEAKAGGAQNDEPSGGGTTDKSNSRKINFYGANKEANPAKGVAIKVSNAEAQRAPPVPDDGESAAEKAPLFTFESGIIIKISFSEPCVDVKDFKAEMRQHTFVRYVDVKEGDLIAHVRVDAATSAPLLIQMATPLACTVLSGDAEEAYWQKIGTDRHQKVNKLLKIKPKRGREKLNKVIANHVRFDD